MEIFRRYWLLWGLLGVGVLTLGDPTGTTAAWGSYLASHRVPEIAICVIFLLSGLPLSLQDVRRGAADVGVIFTSLLVVFIAAPALGWAMGWLPTSPGVRIGIFLVAVMPTTLSTGVVMTTAAGGHTATALLTTLFSNSLAVLTVPVTLGLLCGTSQPGVASSIDTGVMAIRITLLVVLPLAAGLLGGRWVRALLGHRVRRLALLNQLLVLLMVWMALSKSGPSLAGDPRLLALAGFLSVVFHGSTWAVIAILVRLFRFEPGRRETVIFMGGQKTLTLAILLQTTIFSDHGEALLVCVVHHVVHLLMDGYLVGRLAASQARAERRVAASG